MTETYDDDLHHDGFDESRAAQSLQFVLWRRLWRYAARHPVLLWQLAFFAVATAAMDVALPLVTRWTFDALETGGADTNLWPQALEYLICTVTLAASVGGFIACAGRIRTGIAHDIREDGFDNLQRLSFGYFDHRPVGWLMARMTSDCERLSNILAWGFLDLVWGATVMVGIAIAMLVMQPVLALAVLVSVPALVLLSGWFQHRILDSARRVRTTNSRITAAYNESIMGVLTTKAFTRQPANMRDFGTLTDHMEAASVHNQVLAALYLPLVLTLASVATGVALMLGGWQAWLGGLSIGSLVAFLTYTRHFFDPIEQLAHWFAEMQMAQASAERILSLIDARPDIEDDAEVRALIEHQRTLPARPGIAFDGGPDTIETIELRGVDFRYQTGEPVLRGIDLTLRRGESVAIVGPTGSGKTTLVNLICRFYEPTRGQVLIDGIDYRKRALGWLHGKLGMVLQQPHVFAGSIRENIRYGRLDATDDEIATAARLAGAMPFIERLPDGMNTRIGEGGGRLSAGEKQLLSFARALLADPALLVLDEATASIDTETEQLIQRGLSQVLRGRLSLIIAHRLSTIRDADRILVLRAGAIIESGTHAELLAARGHYAEMYLRQAAQGATGTLESA